MAQTKLLQVAGSIANDLRAAFRVASSFRSGLRLGADLLLSRVLGAIPRRYHNLVREVRLRGRITICYRLNKGDLHSVREIWFQEAYKLPFVPASGALLDLGSNIGMASLWLTKNYAFDRVIAVEPDPGNAELVRRNFALNGIAGTVVEAAVGPEEGMARFEFSALSNLGKLSDNPDHGSLIPMISVRSILQRFALDRFALAKIDIEGGEQGLFDGPKDWLAQTDAIIIEFHPVVVDYARLTNVVSAAGLKYIPAHSVFPENMDCFTKV